MLFGIIHKHAAKPLVALVVKLYDDSEIHVHAEDTELTFKTALGVSKINLSAIAHMENISKAVNLRKYLWANKFEIHCVDGSKFFGVPQSPAVIDFRDPHAPLRRGKIKLWEIDWLKVAMDNSPN